MDSTSKTGLVAWWHRTPLYLRILSAMLLGLAVGVLLGAQAAPLAIPSRLVLRLLGALAPGLVLFAIIQALVNARLEKGQAGRLVRLLVLNTLVAITVGLCVANLLKPGHWSTQLRPDA
jgi:Na+/H+-dicarboxylate symporter